MKRKDTEEEKLLGKWIYHDDKDNTHHLSYVRCDLCPKEKKKKEQKSDRS